MANAPHTPGPWELESGTPIDRSITDTHGRVLAIVFGAWREPYKTEAIANARLIASAPNLRDALAEIVQHAAPLVQAGDPLGLDIQRIARLALAELDV